MTMPENNRSVLALVPDRASVAAVSEFLDLCLEEQDVPMKAGYKLKIIADEIYSNIVYYSQAQNARVSFCREADTLYLEFWDDGAAYNPLETAVPDVTAGVEDREIGGLGLFMVKKMADDLRYENDGSGNRVTVLLSADPGKKTLPKEV